MRQDTRFLKILVSKNWVLYETWSKKLIRKFFETTISKCINHTNFLYCKEETFKMVVHITKSRLPINSCYRFSFFPWYFYIKKWQLFIFFPVHRKRTCLDDKNQNSYEVSWCVQTIRREQKCHQHILCKKLV